MIVVPPPVELTIVVIVVVVPSGSMLFAVKIGDVVVGSSSFITKISFP